MAIITTDIKFFHSGGAGNTLATASLGGAKSTTAVTDDTLNNIFDKVIGDEADTGDTEYRGIYFENDHATLTLETTVGLNKKSFNSFHITLDLFVVQRYTNFLNNKKITHYFTFYSF